MAGHNGENEAECEENARSPLRDLCQHVAGTSAEQRIGCAATESDANAGFFLRQLQQHEEHQNDAIQHQKERQKSNN